jgi:hypothetical protein
MEISEILESILGFSFEISKISKFSLGHNELHGTIYDVCYSFDLIFICVGTCKRIPLVSFL